MASIPPSRPSDPRDQAFIREVDEAYREDELKKFLFTWGRWILLVVVLGLVALGGWFWWKAEQTRRIEAISEQFSGALDKAESGGSTEALNDLDSVARSSSSGYRALAQMTSAGIALQGGDEAKAIAGLKAVADDKSAAQALRARAEQMAAALGQDVTKIEAERTRQAEAEAKQQVQAAGGVAPAAAETAAK